MIWYANKSTILIGNGKNYHFGDGFMYVPEFDASWLGGETYHLIFGQYFEIPTIVAPR